jgi:hypothetical protein
MRALLSHVRVCVWQRAGASACNAHMRSHMLRAAPAPAPAESSGGVKRVPVGWEPADEDVPSPKSHARGGAAAAAAAAHGGASGTGITPWWLARVDAPARREVEAAAAAEAEEAGTEGDAASYGTAEAPEALEAPQTEDQATPLAFIQARLLAALQAVKRD